MKQITVADFDNAVKQPHSQRTCILAQTARRLQRERGFWARNFLPGLNDWTDVLAYSTAIAVMCKFDAGFFKPGDEKFPELQTLRASLPITLE